MALSWKAENTQSLFSLLMGEREEVCFPPPPSLPSASFLVFFPFWKVTRYGNVQNE